MHFRVGVIFFLLAGLLVGCRSVNTPLPSVSPAASSVLTEMSSVTPVFSATATPSTTVAPSATATRTPCPPDACPPRRTSTFTVVEDQPVVILPTDTPAPTRTPTPSETSQPTATFDPRTPPPLSLTVTPVFAFIRRELGEPAIIPPALTTPGGGKKYRLKNWDQAAALEALQQLRQYIYSVHHPLEGGYPYNFSGMQLAVNLAARESLLRFPAAPQGEQIDWLLLTSDTLINAGASHTWMQYSTSLSSAPIDRRLAEVIEGGIAQGWFDPLRLGEGFWVTGLGMWRVKPVNLPADGLTPVDNLFGDGRPAYLWRVNYLETYNQYGLVVVVTQRTDGFWDVFPLSSAWMYPDEGWTEVEVLDLTGDRQPEVIVYDSEHQAGMGYPTMRTLIYQWQTDHFVEILHGNLGSSRQFQFSQEGWEYAPPGKDGTVDIQVHLLDWVSPESYGLLHWNGEWMEIKRRRIELPENPLHAVSAVDRDAVGQGLEFGQAAEISGLLQAALGHPSEYSDPDYADFLRFQQAMVAAQQSQVKEARRILQSIVAAPSSANYPLIAAAAERFLENYQGDADLYRSCLAALALMREPLSLCYPRLAFRLLVSDLGMAPDTDVPAVLSQAGVSLAYSAYLDLDNDGLLDWLLVVNIPGVDPTLEPWVLLGSERGYQAVPVLAYDQRWLLESTRSMIEFETLPLPGSRQPGQVLRIGDDLLVFRIHHRGQSAEVELLLALRDRFVSPADRLEVHPEQSELWLYNGSSASSPAWSIYAWPENGSAFTHIDPLERLIFELDQPQQAIPAIQTELALVKGHDNPTYYSFLASRLTYLLGLSYELSGDPASAALTYLDLWRRFPETGFALLARAKLEPLSGP